MQVIGEFFILLGSFFMFLSAVGITKMPDFLMKLQSSSKASAFGVMMMLLGGVFYTQNTFFIGVSVVIFLFLLFTTPIAAHALADADRRLTLDEDTSVKSQF